MARAQVGHKHRTDEKRDLSEAEVVDIMKRVFKAACERDIYTGDGVDMYIIRADGMENVKFELKKD